MLELGNIHFLVVPASSSMFILSLNIINEISDFMVMINLISSLTQEYLISLSLFPRLTKLVI